jgi:hypothetical protein
MTDIPIELLRKVNDLEMRYGRSEVIETDPGSGGGGSSLEVLNSSGAAANANDVGYIDASGEYKTTTTASLIANWCVVITGGANNADIFVARQGRVTVNAATGITAGQFLETSTTAGRAQGRTLASPSIFALALTAESGNTLTALLLTGRTIVPYVSTNDIVRLNAVAFVAGGAAQWTGAINDASPTVNPVTVTTATGALANITPVSSSELGKIIIRNTTRGNSALISSIAGANITFVSVPGNWVNGDALTAEDGTIGNGYRGIDMTGQSEIPTTAVALIVSIAASDSTMTTTSVNVGLHPYETFANSKVVFIGQQVAAVFIRFIAPALSLVGLKFGLSNQNSGALATQVIIVRVNGWIEATP